METERGRWFLAEYARRQRSADTQRLLEAIHRLEAAIGSQVIPAAGDDISHELSAMAAALHATETEMREVRSDRLADRGAVPNGSTAFEDVAARARNLAAGLAATTEALEKAGEALHDEPAVAARITGLEEDLARLDEHRQTQDVLSQRISKAMGLIAHLQERIATSLGDGPPAVGQETPAAAATDTLLDDAEVNYFEADRELFSTSDIPPLPSHDLVADDPENAPHLAGMLDEALAAMPDAGSEDTMNPTTEAAASEPEAEAPTAPEPDATQPAAAEAMAAEGAAKPARRRVVIVRTAQTPAAEGLAEQPPSPDAPAATTAPEAAPPTAPQTADAEPGPEAVMQMFTEAAARHGVSPVSVAAEEGQSAPLGSMTPGPEERRRIVVIRRNSSADTPIPLEDAGEDVAKTGKPH